MSRLATKHVQPAATTTVTPTDVSTLLEEDFIGFAVSPTTGEKRMDLATDSTAPSAAIPATATPTTATTTQDNAISPSTMAATAATATAATATATAATAAAATTTLQDPTKPFSMSDIDDDDSSDDEGDGVYDEIPLSDMTFLEEEQKYTYPCPCGDLFELFVEDLDDGEDIAYCPSCSLKIRVLS